jgi:hypothetical protein
MISKNNSNENISIQPPMIRSSLNSIESSSANLFSQIEERKRAIMKTFDIASSSSQTSSQSSLNNAQQQQQQQQQILQQQQSTQQHQQVNIKNVIYENDKQSCLSTVDSGFASGSSSNQFGYQRTGFFSNINTHQQLPQPAVINESLNKQPINLAVERLNAEIAVNAARLAALNLNNEEAKRRLSSASNVSSASSSAYSSQLLEFMTASQKQQHLIGLELYDSGSNMSELREPSIEKLIGYALPQHARATQQQTQQLSFEKLIQMGCGPDSSSNEERANNNHIGDETLNDQDTGTFLSTDDGEDEDSEDSQALIMSLLSSSATIANVNSRRQIGTSVFDLKRQFMQEQLDAVQKQKEQLAHSQFTANTG